MAATDVGTGASITFQSGFFAEILNIDWSGMSREAIETTNFGTTGARTFIPGDLPDPGELVIEINVDADADPFDVLGAVAETVTLTFPTPVGGSSGATWAASGFATGFEATLPLEDKITGRMTIKFSGDITTANAA